MTKYHFFLRFFFKVLIWFSQGLQCKALPVSYDRKMEKIVDYIGAFSALLTDFSKAIDYNPYPFHCKTRSIWFPNRCIESCL